MPLALRSPWPAAEVVNLESASGLGQALDTGPVAAVIGDPKLELTALAASIAEVRTRYPECLFWLFTTQDALSLKPCSGAPVGGAGVRT